MLDSEPPSTARRRNIVVAPSPFCKFLLLLAAWTCVVASAAAQPLQPYDDFLSEPELSVDEAAAMAPKQIRNGGVSDHLLRFNKRQSMNSAEAYNLLRYVRREDQPRSSRAADEHFLRFNKRGVGDGDAHLLRYNRAVGDADFHLSRFVRSPESKYEGNNMSQNDFLRAIRFFSNGKRSSHLLRFNRSPATTQQRQQQELRRYNRNAADEHFLRFNRAGRSSYDNEDDEGRLRFPRQDAHLLRFN